MTLAQYYTSRDTSSYISFYSSVDCIVAQYSININRAEVRTLTSTNATNILWRPFLLIKGRGTRKLLFKAPHNLSPPLIID